tara:strand:+ start:76 stop:249 length:174 start_codon:yes stop_codon:yes gene_type:complete
LAGTVVDIIIKPVYSLAAKQKAFAQIKAKAPEHLEFVKEFTAIFGAPSIFKVEINDE